MTDTGPAPSTTAVDRGDVATSAALVALVAAVHLVMAYFVGSLPDAVFDAVNGVAGQEAGELAVHLLPVLPLALVVLFWARTRPRGWAAAAVAVGMGCATYLQGLVIRTLLDDGHHDTALRFYDTSTWVVTMLLPVGAALAWGIARRVHRGWWPGLMLAATLAALFRLLDLDAFTGHDGLRAAYLALVYHVVPAVLGGLACWWLDVKAPDARGRT